MQRDDHRRAVIYLRVSTFEQVGGTSLDEQERRCRARCESEGWEVVAVERDAGVSGVRDDRPGWTAVMDAGEAGEVDIVIAASLDRVGRDARGLFESTERLEAAGVDLVLLREGIDTSTPTGRAMRTILAAVVELDHATIRERMLMGRMVRVQQGRWPGGAAPFGYCIVSALDGRGSVLAHDEAEAVTWRAIHQLIAVDGMSTWGAAEELNRAGHRPRRAERWTGANLRRTIQDARGLTGSWLHRFQGQDYRIDIPPILTEVEHAALTSALAERRDKHRSRQGPKRRSLLAGHLTMPCGGSGQGVPSYRADGTRREVHWYRCSQSWAQQASGERCDCRRVHGPDLDEAVWAEVLEVLGDSAAKRAMAAATEPRRADPVAALDAQVDDLTARITVEAAEMREAGLGATAIAAALADLSTQLEAAEVERDRAAAAQRRDLARLQAAGGLRERIDDMGTALDGADAQLRRQLVDLLDVRVTVTGWDVCDRCEGRGLVPWSSVPEGDRPAGPPRGITCPTCHRTRHMVRAEVVIHAPEAVVAAVAEGIPVANLDTERWKRGRTEPVDPGEAAETA